MGKKMLVALMMEGKFSGEGLQALDTDEDLMTAIARELVETAGVGESADAVWRELDQEREKMQPRSAATAPETENHATSIPASVLEAPELGLPVVAAPQPAPRTFGAHLMEPPSTGKKRKKAQIWPTAKEMNTQLSLFE